jgi:ATP-binding cassette, subfamily B, bacterial
MLRRRQTGDPSQDAAPGSAGARRIVSAMMRRHWAALGGAGASTVLMTLADLAQPWPLKFLIDNVIDGHAIPFSIGADELRLLALIAGALIGIALLDAIATYTGELWLCRAGERITHDLRLAMYSHLQRLSLAYHDRRQKGDLVTRLTGDANAVGTLFSDTIGTMAQAVLTLAGMLVVSVIIDPLLGLAMFAVAPVLGLVTAYYKREVKQAARRQRKREGEIASLAAESLAAMRVVKAFGGERYEHERVSERSEERRRTGVYAAGLEARFGGVVDLLGAATVAGVLVLGVVRVAAGAISIGDLVVIGQYARRLYRPLSDLAKQSAKASRSMARAERVAEVLAADEVLEDRPGAFAEGRARGDVELREVTFAYEPGRPVLERLSLRVPAGSRVAIVGPSGAGKSTIGALIARFYDPLAGGVLIDGRDARECSLDWLRNQVGILLQDTVLFTGTVAENIAYGRQAAPEDVVRAARAADADEFISALPGGYDGQLGPQGVGLSGGQRQRIGIARVLLRDPPILVLDEPTTGLDAASEAQVMDGLTALMRGRTTILITHSLALARTADRVVVVDDGRIAQEGTPEDLLAVPGPFRRLAAEQGLVPRRRRPSPPPDPVVPTMRSLLDPDGAAPVLQRSLAPDQRVEDVLVRHVRYRPRRILVVLYEVVLDGARAEAFITAGDAARMRAFAHDPRHRAAAQLVNGGSPSATPLWHDDALRVVIQWLPLDVELPLLSAPAELLTARLRGLGIELDGGPPEPSRLSYVPGRRATLRLGDHILRGYGRERAFLRSPAGWGLAGRGAPVTAAFVGSVPDLRATVQLVTDGTALGSAARSARAAGELLRRLHGLSPAGLEARPPAEVLEAARRSGDVLRAIDPAVDAAVERLLERLARALPSAVPTVTAHGDFQAGELVRRNGDLVVLDLEDACASAAGLDLASYAADARARDGADPDTVLEALLDGYGARPAAVRWHLAAAMLRKAERPFRVLEEDWPARVEDLVADAEGVLGP